MTLLDESLRELKNPHLNSLFNRTFQDEYNQAKYCLYCGIIAERKIGARFKSTTHYAIRYMVWPLKMKATLNVNVGAMVLFPNKICV